MLSESKRKIEATLGEGDQMLDVGGWAKPMSRADWVIDLMPYESRGLYGERDPAPERFSAETWVQRDFCDHEPWPFDDDQFDFVICSHTLEDVRDPIWVCAEMSRVAKAGYIEVPSRLEEQSYGVHGDWVGWSHHHWLVDVSPGRADFVFKSGIVGSKPEYWLTREEAVQLSPEERVQALFWEGRLEAREQIYIGPGEFEIYLAAPVAEWRGGEPPPRPRRRRRFLRR
jgi:hypothetical protein